MIRLLTAAVLVAVALDAPAARALENENLLVGVPNGYKVVLQNTTTYVMISEMVPDGETVDGWTEMITVQIFYNMRSASPEQYRARIQKLWGDACPGSTFAKVKEGIENLYPTLTWSQTCPFNIMTGKPELTWLKAIRGRDSFYLVQKTNKFEPTAEQTAKWTGYLDGITVCDTRSATQPCKTAK